MKILGLVLPFLFLLMSASSCPDEATIKAREKERRRENMCQEETKGNDDCDMKWLVRFPHENFPTAIEILVNEKSIFNECEDLNYRVERSDMAKVVLWDFMRMKAGEKYFFEIRKIPDCDEPKKTKAFYAAEKTVKFYMLNGEQVVLVEN